MARIEFKTKAKPVYNPDESLAYHVIIVPKLERRHCDMNAFRRHPKYSGLANSDLFPNILSRIKRERFGDHFRLDRVPPGVTIEPQGYMTLVSIDV